MIEIVMFVVRMRMHSRTSYSTIIHIRFMDFSTKIFCFFCILNHFIQVHDIKRSSIQLPIQINQIGFQIILYEITKDDSWILSSFLQCQSCGGRL